MRAAEHPHFAIGEVTPAVLPGTGVAFEARDLRRRQSRILRLEADDGVRGGGDVAKARVRETPEEDGKDFLPVNHGQPGFSRHIPRCYFTTSLPNMPAA